MRSPAAAALVDDGVVGLALRERERRDEEQAVLAAEDALVLVLAQILERALDTVERREQLVVAGAAGGAGLVDGAEGIRAASDENEVEGVEGLHGGMLLASDS